MTSEPYLTPHQRRQQRALERRITAVEALDQITALYPDPSTRPPRAAAMHDQLADQLRRAPRKET